MAQTLSRQISNWNTFHDNGPFPTERLLITSLESKAAMPNKWDRYNDAAVEIRRLLADSLTDNRRFRAYGSGWSLSNIAHQRDQMHVNTSLNLKIPLTGPLLHANSGYEADNLFLIQCGNLIKEVSEFLADNGKALRTSGASNGQTLAGAVSTGVHGSTLDFGSVQDFVVGLNLIIGPDPSDVVYLERASRPALSDTFAQMIGARVIRDDGLFNAALVGLGAFGFVHGLVIDADDLFLLNRYTLYIEPDKALRLAETLNFDELTETGEIDATGVGLRPFHYKLYINPYNATEAYVGEVMYRKPYRPGYPSPIPDIKNALYKDLSSWIAQFAARHNRFIPKIVQALKGSVFPTLDEQTEGTLGEMFWDTIHQGPAFACSVGVDHSRARDVVGLLSTLMREEGPIPGLMGLRLVKQSAATLAFTRFPVTCVVEIDGVLWEGNAHMISLDAFMLRLTDRLRTQQIPFTLHWGKNAAWSSPGLIDYMYGTLDNDWKDYRSALLTKPIADLFTNDFLNTVKLSDYRDNAAATVGILQ